VSGRAEERDAVTTEDDFNAALDANPEDWQTRLVYADWLQERSDARAEGYRALGVLRKRPERVKNSGQRFLGTESAPGYGPGRNKKYLHAQFPPDWWALFEARRSWGSAGWQYFRCRRDAEDAAALAFAELPPDRRAELLATPPPARKPRKPAPRKPKSKGKK
jgi:uncharacterized protein (TIGR02996 family)